MSKTLPIFMELSKNNDNYIKKFSDGTYLMAGVGRIPENETSVSIYVPDEIIDMSVAVASPQYNYNNDVVLTVVVQGRYINVYKHTMDTHTQHFYFFFISRWK